MGKNVMAKRTVLVVWAVAILLCLVSTGVACTHLQIWSARVCRSTSARTADSSAWICPPYDIIILTGNTSPLPVGNVAAQCEQLMAAGKKIFINGYQPYLCFAESGQLIENLYYADRLFGAAKGVSKVVTGTPVLPASLERDPMITAIGIKDYPLSCFVLPNPAPVQVTLGGQIIAFLGPTGGALRGGPEYEYNILDYGKLVNYLRYGDPMIVGFANDRIEGLPVVSWEVHCHAPYSASARNAVIGLAERYSIPLDCLLTLCGVTPEAATWWESVTSPLIAKGSHSRTHPGVWADVSDVLYETTQAVEDQKLLIPSTIDCFNFSGDMSPTAAQMDQIYAAGMLFGGFGIFPRQCPPGRLLHQIPVDTHESVVA